MYHVKLLISSRPLNTTTSHRFRRELFRKTNKRWLSGPDHEVSPFDYKAILDLKTFEKNEKLNFPQVRDLNNLLNGFWQKHRQISFSRSKLLLKKLERKWWRNEIVFWAWTIFEWTLFSTSLLFLKISLNCCLNLSSYWIGKKKNKLLCMYES